MKAMKRLPWVWFVEPAGKHRLRVFFSTGKIAEYDFPKIDVRKAKVMARGAGIDPGDGLDRCAATIHQQHAVRVWRKAK